MLQTLPKEYPPVSIIIVTWNALPLLQKFLPSVVATDYPALQIIVADNASEDGSMAWVKKNYPQIKVIRHPENWAFCKGNNAALPHATGKYVLFLNNDVEVPAGWLKPLVATMEAHPEVAAVQPKLKQYQQRDHFEYAGGSGGFLDRFGYPFTRGRLFFTLEADHGQYDTACDIDWATGAAMLVRRKALDQAGGFDEQFVMHMEEIDLCWRFWRLGYRVCVEPKSTVYHLGGGSLSKEHPYKVYLNFRNNLLLLFKNLTPAQWWQVMPVRVVLDGAALLYALIRRRPKEAQAILKAYFDGHRMRKAYKSTRPRMQGIGQPPSYRGSVVVDYFVRKQRYFSKLPKKHFLRKPTTF